MRKYFQFALVLILTLVIAGCGKSENTSTTTIPASGNVSENSGEAKGKFEKIKIAYSAQTADQLPLFVAVEHGIFEKYGLEVEPIYVSGSGKTIAALVGNSVQYGFTSAGAIASAAINGQKTIAFANLSEHAAVWLYGQKNIEKIEDLKGKSLITASVGTTYVSMANYAVEEHGLTAKEDIEVINIAGSGDRQAAFLSNAGDAMVTGAPFNSQLDEEGYPILMDLTEIDITMLPLTATPEYYQANMDQNIAVVKALSEANQFIKDNREEAVNTLTKYIKTPIEDSEKSYETLMIIEALPEVPKIEDDAFMFTIEHSADERLENKTAEDFKEVYTNEIIEQLESEGFFEQLQGA